MDCIFPGDQNIARIAVQRHAAQSATRIFEHARRLSLSSPRDCQCEDAVRSGDVKQH